MVGGRIVAVTQGKRLAFRKGPKTALTTAKRALRMAKGNRTFEVLKYNLVNTAMTASAVPVVRYIQPPVTDGERQTLQHIEGKIWVRQNLTSALIDNYRIDIVLDRFPSGVEITPLSLYEDATPRITALKSFDLRNRYKIVKSFMGAFEASSPVTRMHNFFIRSGLVCESDGNNPNQANVNKNAYYIIFWTEATTNTPILTYDLQIVSITA